MEENLFYHYRRPTPVIFYDEADLSVSNDVSHESSNFPSLISTGQVLAQASRLSSPSFYLSR